MSITLLPLPLSPFPHIPTLFAGLPLGFLHLALPPHCLCTSATSHTHTPLLSLPHLPLSPSSLTASALFSFTRHVYTAFTARAHCLRCVAAATSLSLLLPSASLLLTSPHTNSGLSLLIACLSSSPLLRTHAHARCFAGGINIFYARIMSGAHHMARRRRLALLLTMPPSLHVRGAIARTRVSHQPALYPPPLACIRGSLPVCIACLLATHIGSALCA